MQDQNPKPYADVPGYESIEIVSNLETIEQLQRHIHGMDKGQLENLYVHGDKLGTALLFRTESLVMEIILSKHDGTLHTLYRDTHPMFKDRNAWLQHRLVLTEVVNDLAAEANPDLRSTRAINEFGAALHCPVRAKGVRVHSLGTAQLLDVIKAHKATQQIQTVH